ncbi:MAG: hypothetical protein O3C05_00920 [Proteobacteria bacterium]|nr:hypothetical protein [Pseudomonadota bacterium]
MLFDEYAQFCSLQNINTLKVQDIIIEGASLISESLFRISTNVSSYKSSVVYGYQSNLIYDALKAINSSALPIDVIHEGRFHADSQVMNQEDLKNCIVSDDALFDIAISNLILQFSNTPERVLAYYASVIKNDGFFTATLVGGRSLYELRDAFALADQEIYGGVFLRVAPMIRASDIVLLAKRTGFKDIVVHSNVLDVRYNSIYDIVSDIRAFGASNYMLNKQSTLPNKNLFKKANDHYSKMHSKDNKLKLTIEIITLSCFKKSISSSV